MRRPAEPSDAEAVALPPALHLLGQPCYLHHPPTWLWRGVLMLTLLLACAALGFAAWRWRTGHAGIAEALLAAFAMPFLLLVLRPGTWQLPISLAADRRGIYFLGGEGGDACFVPWQDIGPMSIERVNMGSGVGRTVVLSIVSSAEFWEPANRSRFMRHLLQSEEPSGYRRLPIGNQFIRPERTKAALEALRRVR